MAERESPASDESERRGYAAVAVLTILLLVGLVALPFVPLLLSGLESLALGTDRVEDFCRRIGIHDELSAFYQAVIFRWFK